MSIFWQSISQEFKPDGSLRDIYVSPATPSDWQYLLDFLKQHGAEVSYSIDGTPSLIPSTVVEIFATRPNASPLLEFSIQGIRYLAFFFDENQIELTFDERDIKNQTELDVLMAFLQSVGDLLLKPVSVTPENLLDEAFLVYEPASREFRYIPPSLNSSE